MSVPNISLKPLVVVHCRNFEKNELTEFFKWYNSVIVINEQTINKKVIEFSDKDVVLCDLRKQKCRDWLSENVKFLGPHDKLVLVKNSGDSVEDEAFMTKITNVCKRLHVPKYGGFTSKLEFLHHLLCEKVSAVITNKKKKLLKKLLGCLFS